MGKDIHVVSMDVETIAVIKKNKKIQHESLLIKSQVIFEENFKNPI